ncbi:MAG: autotransporter-associated beta strand repeat-containing protein [Kiritimatiellae bacterium]|nr:autotransporter-associated beta strand repeat-containing protein [Kiritimatiellia bacterium]
MNTKMRIIWSAMCLTCCVNAEHVSSFDSLYNAESGYVVMKGSDKEYRSSYTTAGQWSDGAVPHSGTNYYVGSEYKLTVATQRTSYVAAPFAGDELVVAGWLRDYGAAKYQTWLGKTRMLAGSEYFNNSVGSVNGGPMIIEGTEDNPVRIYGNSYNNQWKAYKVDFSSSVNVNGHVRFDGVGKNHKYLILSDLPDFYGAIMIDACTIKGAENYVNMPGGFNVYSNSTLLLDAVDGSSTLGSLKLCTGGKLSLPGEENTHCINITNKLELAEDSILTTDKFRTWVKSGTPNRYPVFRLSPEAVAAGMPDLSKVQLRTVNPTGRYFDDTLPELRLVTDELDNGGKLVSISHYEWVKLTNTITTSVTPFPANSNNEACDPSHFWSDGLPPSPEKDYYIPYSNYVKDYGVIFKSSEFNGHSLILDGASVYFNLYSSKARIPLVVNGGGRLRLMSNPRVNYNLSGSFTILNSGESSNYRIQVGNRSRLTVESTIKGNGNLLVVLSPEHQKDSNHYSPRNWTGTLVLSGDNSEYQGKISVYAGKKGSFQQYFDDKGLQPYAPSAVSNVTLVVSTQENLGGALSGFTFDALTVSNECRLVLNESAIFDEPTRGWSFPERGYIQISEGKNVAVGKTITYGSELVKEGAGTLTLMSAPAFYSEGQSVSTPNGAKLRVQSGALRIAAQDAVKGLNLHFDAGARLVIPVGSDDEVLPAGGLDLTQTSVVSSDAKLKVELDVSNVPVPPEGTMRVPLFTVASGSDLSSRISVARPYRDRIAFISTVSNEDGTVTVNADVRHVGMIFTVR